MQLKMSSLINASDYLFSDLLHPKIRIASKFVLWGGILVLAFWFIYFVGSTLVMPYPIEYREGTAQVTTEFLLRGENPFSLENQPLGMNNYGIMYNFFVLPFAALFGNTLLVHRAVTLAFIILSLLLVFRTIFNITRNAGSAILGSLLVATGLAGRGGLGAFPSAMGAFLFLAGILLPLMRSFDYRGLFCSALLCVIAFLTKPYFAFAFAIVASYVFFFVSKKKGWLYGLFFATLMVIFCFLVRYLSELYFVDTFISNLSNMDRSPQHSYAQLKEMIHEYYPGVFVALAFLLLREFKHVRSADIGAVAFKNAVSGLNYFSMGQPLISKRPNYCAYAFICSALVFIFVLGLHQGAYMTYIYQIVAPPFLIWLFQGIRFESRFALISIPLLLINAFLLSQTTLNANFLRQKDSPAWAELYEYVNDSHHILNSPVITSRMIELGLWPVDSGQTDYFYSIKPYPNQTLLGPNYDVVKYRGREYKKDIQHTIKNKGFDMIILTENRGFMPRFIPQELIARDYFIFAVLDVDMPQTNERWKIAIWKPISENP